MLRPIIGNKGRRQKDTFGKPLPLLKDENCRVVQSFGEMKEAHLCFHAANKASDIVHPDNLAKVAFSRLTSNPYTLVAVMVESLPTKCEIDQLFASSKKRSVHGCDPIPNKMHALAPLLFSYRYYPLFLKCASYCAEPLLWRGGEAGLLSKAGGFSDVNKAFREILISDAAGKEYHKRSHDKANHNYAEFCYGSQCGCVASRGNDFTSHIARSFMHFAAFRKLCAGMILWRLRLRFIA